VFWPESVSGAFQKYLLEPGDVCIAMDRPFTRDRVLRCGLIQGADLPALLVQRVTRLRAHHNRIMPEFLILVVQSPGMAERLAGRQTPGGYAPHISGRDISEFTFALPPLTVQERIAEVIGAMDAKITAVRAEANRLRSVRAGLLSGLLNRAIDIESAEVGV
jgi:type I restriction enzyme S subunit